MKLTRAVTTGLAILGLTPALVQAADLTVTIENLTRGVYFTPLAVAAHPEGSQLFQTGQPASTQVQAMAEGGDIAGLEVQLGSLGATQANNPAGGLLAPGASTTASLNTDGTANTQLSLTAMLLPTNDGFVALNAINIPTTPGTYSFYANAYDAGTEGNDEVRGSGSPGEAGFPVPPPLEPMVGTGATGITAAAEGFVHIHRGVLGDSDNGAGPSDIDSGLHRWLNPVARITVIVN